MATTIKLKNSVTTTNAPSSLVQGEVAINITDKKVWVGNAATTPIQLLGDGGSASFTSIAFGAGTVSSPSITFTGDTNTGIYSPAADTIAFTEGGVESMRIDSSGNVGIGTSSPSKKLQVAGDIVMTGSDGMALNPVVDAASLFINRNGTLTSNVQFGGTTSNISGGSGGGARIAIGTQLITFSTFPATTNAGDAITLTERMRITSGGNVLIGNTSGTSLLTLGSSETVNLNQVSAVTAGTTGKVSTSNTSAGGAITMQYDYISSAGYGTLNLDSAGSGLWFRTFDTGSSSYDYRFRFAAAGSATSTTGSWGTISDARTKDVLGAASSQWDDIKQLNFVKYKLKKDVAAEQTEKGYVAPTMLGVVAQELEQTSPKLIEEISDPDLGTVKSVKTTILYMKAVKALQEAMERIEKLETEVATLKAK